MIRSPRNSNSRKIWLVYVLRSCYETCICDFSILKIHGLGAGIQMELFGKYQIPSDLLSYDGRADAPTSAKLARVRGHVDKVMKIVQVPLSHMVVSRK